VEIGEIEMSKLTPEQKAANKAAQKVRDRAFAARRREYDKAIKAAQELANSCDFAKRRDEAGDELEREYRARNQAIDDITIDIAELEDKKARISAQYALSIRPKKEASDAAWRAFREHTEAVGELVREQFPDIVGVWYVSQWQVPPEVQAEMDRAHRDALEAK
jgi:hypothetical protein